MKLLCSLLWLLTAIPVVSSAQEKTSGTSVCDIVAHPQDFDGKIVRLRATVLSGFEVFAIGDPQKDCGAIWLTYADAGPTAIVSLGSNATTMNRPAIELRRDGAFKRFESLLSAEMHPKHRGTMCIACRRYEVTATMTGRLDFAGEPGGFGHMNGYKQQFVLESVTDVRGRDLSSRYDATEYSTTPVHFPTAYFRGRVTGPNGKGIERAEVAAISIEDVPLYMHDFTERTDKKGRFKLEVPPGKYVLGVNLKRPPSQSVPFPPTYYPSSQDRNDAKVFAVVDRQKVNIAIGLREALTPRKILLRVLWPDGSPVEQANVWLAEERNPRRVVGTSVSHTDGNGEFDLTGFNGISYIVHANIYKKPGYVPFCAPNQKVDATDTSAKELVFTLTITGEVCRSNKGPAD